MLDYVLREMTDSSGGFYSAEDADSEGQEGKYYVWTLDEIRRALGERDAALFAAYYDVTEDGNFEGRNILHRTIDRAEAARLFHKPDDELERALGEDLLLTSVGWANSYYAADAYAPGQDAYTDEWGVSWKSSAYGMPASRYPWPEKRAKKSPVSEANLSPAGNVPVRTARR